MALANSAVLSAVQSPVVRVDGVLKKTFGLSRKFGGSVAAYSLRDIGDDRYVVEVRRNGDDAVKKFKGSGVINGDLADWVTAGGGQKNGLVTAWYDQSGNGNHLYQDTFGKQPTLVVNGVVLTQNGKPRMDFSILGGVYLDTALGVTVSSQAQFYVCKVTDYAASRAISGMKTSNANFFRFTGTDVESYKANGQGTTFGTIAEAQQLIVSVDRDASNQTKMFENNVQSGVTRTTITGNYQLERVGTRNGGADPFLGAIQEIILYDGDMSGDRSAITSEINDYYGAFN